MTASTEHEITGDVLLEMDVAMLKEIDLIAFGRRVRVYNAIKELRHRTQPGNLMSSLSTTGGALSPALTGYGPESPAGLAYSPMTGVYSRSSATSEPARWDPSQEQSKASTEPLAGLGLQDEVLVGDRAMSSVRTRPSDSCASYGRCADSGRLFSSSATRRGLLSGTHRRAVGQQAKPSRQARRSRRKVVPLLQELPVTRRAWQLRARPKTSLACLPQRRVCDLDLRDAADPRTVTTTRPSRVRRPRRFLRKTTGTARARSPSSRCRACQWSGGTGSRLHAYPRELDVCRLRSHDQNLRC